MPILEDYFFFFVDFLALLFVDLAFVFFTILDVSLTDLMLPKADFLRSLPHERN